MEVAVLPHYELGTAEASEALIKDLYIDLRAKVNAWSEITKQTPQARMGYIGQHLVSVVTGFPGGKSGARGYDLVMDNGHYGEIKTCYKVDQLGSCQKCGAAVSSLEKTCSACGSSEINRKDDSKWLISIRNPDEFAKVLDPLYYYFVLFEFEDLLDPHNQNVVASIWEVDPRQKGFAYCMFDYYLNIRSKSSSKAPFNMWPHSFKFALTNPKLIYRSRITAEGAVETLVFPTWDNVHVDELAPLTEYSSSRTATLDAVRAVYAGISGVARVPSASKSKLLSLLEDAQKNQGIPNSELCDCFAEAIYRPLLTPKKTEIPEKYLGSL